MCICVCSDIIVAQDIMHEREYMKNISIKVDFNHVIGKMKPMHGIGQPPMPAFTFSDFMYHYLTDAGIPYSRLHDVGGWMGGGLYVDIPNLFRDFDADENDPASYDFAFTDKIIEGLIRANCEPYFRLGVSIENAHMVKAYRIFPPKDFYKWARICEHVIRHYREGWANGYHFDIIYWEIWNEPDDCFKNEWAAMWKGTPQQYYELYSITAKHLKACFGDTIKVGGYGHCGFYEYEQDEDLNGIPHEDTRIYEFTISFMHAFFKYQKQTNAPIDFFSWHVYDNCHDSTRKDFKVIANHADYCRKILDGYGYTKAEHHLNEWNLWTKPTQRDCPKLSARTLAFTLMMQNTSTDLMCFYDGSLGYTAYGALINPDSGTPYRNYYAFATFNTLYQLKNQVLVECEGNDIFVGAAREGRKAAVAIANPNDFDVIIDIRAIGFPTSEMELHRIDDTYRYTKTGEKFGEGKFLVPANGCMEIKLYDLG